MTDEQPVSLALRRLLRIGHLDDDDLGRELTVLADEVQAWDDDREFEPHMREVFARYQQLLSRSGSLKAQACRVLLSLVESAYLDGDEEAERELEEFLSDLEDDR